MTLTTHAIVGAAVASAVPSHPIIGFAGGFLSHFAIDSIPHWNEGRALLRSVEKEKGSPLKTRVRQGKDLLHDVAVVGADSLLGFLGATLLLFYFFDAPLLTVLLGAFAGQLPDGLQFVYFNYHPWFMDGLQRFHSRIQTESANIAYLGIEAMLVLAVIAAGISGIFVL